ncbi:hypothetical protein DEO45_16190 [Rhodanobacter denitrificans]|uniref:NIPSNAP domain-containing protein n=1 Tax=Rhodanobacter denitrificans TaxID=666685 RepID=A0A368KD26_9GAMM|nr:hypothetical protein [Rhodanobacter denitrificans]RCS28573.1 hypothetical protein DEO45_16190 [Rhodanobacter denitrificans]
MKNSTVWPVLAFALSCATAQAADDVRVIRDFTDTVAPADQQAYEAGTRNFNQCLHQHGFKYHWTAWTHQTGDTYSYSYVSDPVPWASFDAMDAAVKACLGVIKSDVNPHLKSETSAFFRAMPEMTHMPKGMSMAPPPLIEVIYFRLKPGHEPIATFETVAKKIAAAAEKTQWPHYFQIGRVQDAGDGAPDFIVVLPAKSWADLGAEANPDLWKMVESVYGKSDADAMRKSLNAVTTQQSSHVDSYNAELSYIASGK